MLSLRFEIPRFARREVLDRVAIIIPARLGSRRFPRKVLACDTGKYLIQHVHERVAATPGVARVIIATDSAEVEAAARSFGAEVALTSAQHVSGTDRVAEVARGLDADVVVNVQGDEPLTSPEDVRRLADRIAAGDDVVLATLARARSDAAGFRDPNIVKVVLRDDGRALYFSRSPIPGGAPADPGAAPAWHQHIGIYAFRADFLQEFTRLPPGKLEKLERLEQLRALEHGYAIDVLLTEHEYRGIDTEAEYAAFVRQLGSPVAAEALRGTEK